jgi:endonuclease/exonuclease/phosphatase (EEP) superfamily protein YafD
MTGRGLAAGLVGMCAILVLAADFLGLEKFYPFPMLLAMRPVGSVCLLLVAVVIVVARPGWWPSAAVLAAVAVVAVVFVVFSRVIPSASASPLNRAPDRPTLSVLSFNVYEGHADVASLVDAISTERPDLVVLPEAGERYRQLVLASIGSLGYQSWTTGRPRERDVDGIVVLAARSMGTLNVRVLDRQAKFAWMELTGGVLGPVRVLAVHTAAPVMGSVPAWRADLAALRGWCQSSTTPTMLVGDFNATVDHRELRSLGCTDVAAAVGRGLTGTWPTSLPSWFGVQIDHVLVGGGIAPGDARVLDLPGSDHRAILVRVTLPGAATRAPGASG